MKEKLIKIVKSYFDGEMDGDTWHYEMPRENIFTGGINLQCKVGSVKYAVAVSDDLVQCYHIAPIKAEEAQRAEMAEFITRANYDTKLGNFEMDFRDGELRYKMVISSNDLLGDKEAALKSMNILMILGVRQWEQYGDNIAAVALGFTNGKSIEELVAESENQVAKSN